MPKTTKNIKRASSASSKKSGLKRRFDLTNRKVQFFVVIAIVAVLGGGWFTYRSFAATYDSTNITFWPADFVSPANATRKNELILTKDAGSSKQGMTVAKTKSITIASSTTPLARDQLFFWLSTYKGKVAKLCVSIAPTSNLGNSSGSIAMWGAIQPSGAPVSSGNVKLDYGVYKEVCTGNFTINPSSNVHIIAGQGEGTLDVSTGISKSEDVFISNIKVSIVAPTPAPAPTK